MELGRSMEKIRVAIVFLTAMVLMVGIGLRAQSGIFGRLQPLDPAGPVIAGMDTAWQPPEQPSGAAGQTIYVEAPNSLSVALTGTSARPEPIQRRVEIRSCAQQAPCTPKGVSTLIVFVTDVDGGAIQEAEALVAPVLSVNGRSTSRGVRTDIGGMAAVSLSPGESYTVRVLAESFRSGPAVSLTALDAGVQTLIVALELDPEALGPVLKLPVNPGPR